MVAHIHWRCVMPLWAAETPPVLASPRQLALLPIPVRLACVLNRHWHSRLPEYRTGACLTSTVCYAAVAEGWAYAVAIWSPPVARLLPPRTWLELRRLAIAPDAPHCTASWMLGQMVRRIRADYPWITRLISYQDCAVHTGTIYRAAGWQIGRHHPGGTWNRPDSRNRNGRPRTRPDAQGATGPKVRWDRILREDHASLCQDATPAVFGRER